MDKEKTVNLRSVENKDILIFFYLLNITHMEQWFQILAMKGK